MNVVFVELDRCIACLSCQRACRFQKVKRNEGWQPDIFVHVDIDRRRIFAGTCLQCETAHCMKICPVKAISRDPGTGAVVVANEICLGCGICVTVCPYGYMQLDRSLRGATKCDLCGGDPACVRMCMAEALHFGSINILAEYKRKKSDRRLGLRAVLDDGGDGQ